MPQLYINWVDIIILFLLGLFTYRGIKKGFVTQSLTIIFFIAGIFIGGWFFPHIIKIHDRTLFVIVNSNTVVLFSILMGTLGYILGNRLHFTFGKERMHLLENILNIATSVIFGLIIIWLLASLIGRLPFAGFSNSVNDSLIIQFLDQNLPPVPAIFASLGQQIDPSVPSEIFVKTPLQTQRYTPLLSSEDQQTANQYAYSIVRITSFGCGGIVSGSGFVIGPQLVMTNAHVIAGVKRPIIKYGTQSYAGNPVFYDSSLDVAILRVDGLKAKPLVLDNKTLSSGTKGIALGYPGGNFTATPVVFDSNIQLQSNNLYGMGTVERDVYIFDGYTNEGSSGGPIILENGLVAGVVFAKSASQNNVTYALTPNSVKDKVQQSLQSYRKVNTGFCLSNQ
ncbi:MAG: MarP family serine protease [Candidatus Saccharimonadales bacterium]